jgi:hypothetical protein
VGSLRDKCHEERGARHSKRHFPAAIATVWVVFICIRVTELTRLMAAGIIPVAHFIMLQHLPQGCTDSHALSGPIPDSLNTEDYGRGELRALRTNALSLPHCAFAKAAGTTRRKTLRKLLTECDSRVSLQPAGRESVSRRTHPGKGICKREVCAGAACQLPR